VSIGSIYQYFPNKKELLQTLLSQERDLARRVTESALRSEQHSPLAEAIPRIVRAVLAHQRSRARYHDALFHQTARWLGDEQHSGHPSRRSAEALIAAYIRRRADEVDVSDPDRAAVFIVQTVTALAHEAIVAPRNESEGEALALELGRMIGRYLGVSVK
jgi:AcrR family transcriptional regulator